MSQPHPSIQILLDLANDVDEYLASDTPLECLQEDIGAKFQRAIDLLTFLDQPWVQELKLNPPLYWTHPDTGVEELWLGSSCIRDNHEGRFCMRMAANGEFEYRRFPVDQLRSALP